MPVIQRVVKPKTRKGKKALLSREPKIIEDAKQTLFIKGSRSSETLNSCVKDLYDLKKPDARMMQKKNNILPFEDVTPLEQFSRKLSSSLFVFTSHNKKHPNSLIVGRMFDNSLLDMVEFGVQEYEGLAKFKVDKVSMGIKPILIFNGELFEHNRDYSRIKSLLVDLFQRDNVENIRLQGLEHTLSFTAIDNKIQVRSYRILLKKSGSRIPRIELEEIGPRMELIVRRTKLASDDLYKQACKKPKELKVKKKKNISKDTLGTMHGKIHMGKQRIQSIQTRKMKGLKKTMGEKKAERKRRSNQEDGMEAKRSRTDGDAVEG
ncbi:ribosome production factor 2 homolog [Neodiprion pinetum]|uniref:Ribosome production factor 2 homolog n=1 Tax=Neodiprion lecontei TaxID=441921 RepID=A0A6J0B904_NEOLC|nr:ribosome production factor 2 homolog [Neodiprion lecontei]XP_046482157.1 ribosome production factor 2 homolog [Neodiprion pinetum]